MQVWHANVWHCDTCLVGKAGLLSHFHRLKADHGIAAHAGWLGAWRDAFCATPSYSGPLAGQLQKSLPSSFSEQGSGTQGKLE